jgi:hypothetical protein
METPMLGFLEKRREPMARKKVDCDWRLQWRSESRDHDKCTALGFKE